MAAFDRRLFAPDWAMMPCMWATWRDWQRLAAIAFREESHEDAQKSHTPRIPAYRGSNSGRRGDRRLRVHTGADARGQPADGRARRRPADGCARRGAERVAAL